VSGFFSGSFEPFWPHSILLTASILASFAVAAGIVMENPKWSLANVLVVGGVAVEAACTLLLFGFDEGISSSQKRKIDAQQSKIIALETQLAPRTVTAEQAARIISRLSAASNDIDASQIGYAFGASTDEEIAFAIALSANVLATLGFDWKDWPKGAWPTGETWLPDQKKWVGAFPMSGIEVDVLDPSLSGVGQALIAALKETGFDGVRENPRVDAGLQQSAGQMLILVLIGTKPAFRP
jgi:hypothetical protein